MNADNWDWAPNKKIVTDLGAIYSRFSRVDELTVSPDGEKIAAPVMGDNGFAVCVNDTVWDQPADLLWHLRFLPDGRLFGLAKTEDQWTVIMDGKLWQERFEYIWNPKIAANGKALGLLFKRDDAYGVVIEDKPWDNGFLGIRDFCLSPDGTRAAATVQMEALAEADIFGFAAGVWSVAVNGMAWDKKFINAWSPIFNFDGSKVAAEIRSAMFEYSIAINGEVWPAVFGCTWAPVFRPQNGSAIAPVRDGGKWKIAENGAPVWEGRYNQIWHLVFGPDGKKLAAVVSEDFGRWSIVVDGRCWKKTWGDMVDKPVFSPDGSKVAAVVKHDNRWTIAVDGQPWPESFDMIWNPVFSPGGAYVAAKAEQGSAHFLIINGVRKNRFERMWEPVFSPDGSALLLRYIEDNKYVRQVVAVKDI